MSKSLYVIAAYGRNRSNAATNLADWYAGKDFRIIGGPYCSIRDLPLAREQGYTSVVFNDAFGNELAEIPTAEQESE